MRFSDIYPSIPNEVPRMGNAVTRWIGCLCMKLLGWKVRGVFPKEKKMVLAAVPHTSNWDFILAMVAMLGGGVRLSFLMKKEAFFWPFKSLFIKMGGIPTDRSASEDIVQQITRWYDTHDNVWVGITPEGTRSSVKKLKTGFLRIAEKANVPVLLLSWDYPTKTIMLDKIWPTSGDYEQDAEDIKRYLVSKYTGRNSGKQSG